MPNLGPRKSEGAQWEEDDYAQQCLPVFWHDSVKDCYSVALFSIHRFWLAQDPLPKNKTLQGILEESASIWVAGTSTR